MLLKGIFQTVNNGIAMVEVETLNMECYFGSKEVRRHSVLCIIGDFPMWWGRGVGVGLCWLSLLSKQFQRPLASDYTIS